MKKVFDVGDRIGTIKSMYMGDKFTSVKIVEDPDNYTIEHSIVITNGVARSFKTGDRVSLKLEIYE